MLRFACVFALLILLVPACASSPETADEAPSERADTDEMNETNATDETDDSDAEGSDSKGAASDDGGLDGRLSDYEYPFEVETFAFDAQRQDLEMAYMDVAPEEDERGTVLLLHGKNFSGAYWEETIETLVEEGYRVVVPDQIGFGKSTKPADFQYSLHGLATYTDELLDELDVDQAHVVGHSMGGMLAARYALMHPDETESLTLVNPVGLEDYKRVVPYQTVDQWFEQELEKEPADIKNYMRETYFDGEWSDEYDPLVEILQGWIRGPDYERIAWNSALHYDMIFTQPVVYEFDLIEAPTLLILGTRDRTAIGKGLVSDEERAELGDYPEMGRDAEEAIPDARLELLEDTGHLPQFERFDTYESLLTDFLADPNEAAR
ncbi:MAG: alpha/beta fold hydrolase [Persicimonas sp.]